MKAVICPHCQSNIDDNSNYCGHCGVSLIKDTPEVALDMVSEKIDAMVEKARHEVAVEAENAMLSELRNFKSEAESWVKATYRFLLIGVALVVSVAGFFGYKSWTDFTSLIDAKKAEVEKQAHDVSEVAAIVTPAKVADIKKKLHLLGEKMADADRIVKETKVLSEKVKNLEDTRYQIIVHIKDSDETRLDKKITWLTEELGKHGFTVGPYSFKVVSASPCEILYYNASTKVVAEKIQNEILNRRFPGIKTKLISSDKTHDPFLIFIKIPVNYTPNTPCR